MIKQGNRQKNWTPGPWMTNPLSDGSTAIWANEKGRIAVSCLTWAGNYEGQANARLIAAAPELVEALEELLSNDPDRMFKACRAGEALLAKVYGDL
jgi:hypothetical protein